MSNSWSWQRLCVLCVLSSPGLEKPLAVLNLELKTSSPLAPQREKKEECFCAWKGWNPVLALWEAGCQPQKAKSLFWKSKLQVSHLQHMDVLHLLLHPPPPLCLCSRLLPALLVALSPALDTVSPWPCWQQSCWHRRVKLEAAFLFPTSLWSFPAGKPWLLQFPTLQLIHSFPEFPKGFVGSQNTCSVNSDPGGKLAEMSFLDWKDDFVFKLQVVGSLVSLLKHLVLCFRNFLGCASLCPLSWLSEHSISQAAFPARFQEVPESLPELCSSCWMENSITGLCQLIPASSNCVKSGQESDLELGNDSEDLIWCTISGPDSAPETQGQRSSSCYFPFQQEPNNSLNPTSGSLCYPFGEGNKNNITKPTAAP